MSQECPFCNIENSISTKIHSYEYWDLFLHAEEKRINTRKAAGFLALRRHEPDVLGVSQEEYLETQRIIGDAALRLCEYIGVTYTGHGITGFNRGTLAGQTVEHAHIHIMPVAEEDPDKLKGRVGISAAFEALHKERMEGASEK